ncbi:type VII secretion protein EccE [Rugosimonospora africana]|uniref:Type VII secretion protein EccE n=1 Tax=Rugosimonospora africana TaxID=556532 RepID=A0A8J3VQ38_9ACTN|nr:type VII secretion protein EccE [Rugosimonospora africana]GIH14066.1 type VII secretion protein EccE [Rugosimonospora africana]
MTEAPPRVRAVAQVTTVEPVRDDAEPQLKRRPGYLGAVHVVQLLLVEAVLFGVLGALTHNYLAAGITAGAGALLILAATLRRGGRWWFEQQTVARQYRRRRGHPDVGEKDPRLAALHWLTPGLTVSEVESETGARTGIACDAAGWYGAIAIGEADSMHGDGGSGVPLDVLARSLDDAEQPGAVVQVVTQSVPAPSLDMDSRHLAAHSYQELQALAGPVPADRTTWVAVRLEARSRAEAGVAGGYDAEHAPTLVANLVRKVSRSLRESRLPHQVLSADELIDALSRACDLDSDAGGAAQAPREEWTAWHSGRAAHASFWLRDWPRVDDAATLFGGLSATPSASTTVSLALTRDHGDLAMRCLIRVAAPGDGLAHLCETLDQRARAVNAELFRLDGEQGPAVYASAPTGGGAA